MISLVFFRIGEGEVAGTQSALSLNLSRPVTTHQIAPCAHSRRIEELNRSIRFMASPPIDEVGNPVFCEGAQ